jgi:hypothetical protein
MGMLTSICGIAREFYSGPTGRNSPISLLNAALVRLSDPFGGAILDSHQGGR